MRTAIIWLVVIPLIAVVVTKDPKAVAHLMELTANAATKLLNASANAFSQFLAQI